MESLSKNVALIRLITTLLEAGELGAGAAAGSGGAAVSGGRCENCQSDKPVRERIRVERERERERERSGAQRRALRGV